MSSESITKNSPESTGSSEAKAELATLEKQLADLEFVMESLSLEKGSKGDAYREHKQLSREATSISDEVVAESLGRGGVVPEDKERVVAAEDAAREAGVWKEGLETNSTMQFADGESSDYNRSGLSDGAFKEKLLSLGIDPDAKPENAHVYRNNVEGLIYQKHYELTRAIREKKTEVPGGTQELMVELLRGANGAMSEQAVERRNSLLKSARSGHNPTIQELYNAIGIDKYYPLAARKEALAFVARNATKDVEGSIDHGESIAAALGEYAEAYDAAYSTNETSTDWRLREEAIERGNAQLKLMTDLFAELRSAGETIKVSALAGSEPHFYGANDRYITSASTDRDARFSFPEKLSAVFTDGEELTPDEVIERMRPVYEEVQMETSSAQAVVDARKEKEEALAKIGWKTINQDLVVT